MANKYIVSGLLLLLCLISGYRMSAYSLPHAEQTWQDETKSDSSRIHAIIEMASNTSIQIAPYHNSIQEFASVRHTETMVDALYQIALAEAGEGAYNEALQTCNLGRSISLSLCFKQGFGKMQLALGVIQDQLGNYGSALRCHLSSMNIFKEVGDSLNLANSLINIGRSYYRDSNLRQAEAHFLHSLEVWKSLKENGNPRAWQGAIICLSNLGGIYQKGEIQDFDKAQHSLDEALQLILEQGLDSSRRMVSTLNNLAALQRKQAHYTPALDTVSRALGISLALGDSATAAFLYHHMGQIYRLMEDCEQGAIYNEKALKIAQRYNLQQIIYEATKELTRCYETQGQLERVIAMQRLESQAKDSLKIQSLRLETKRLEVTQQVPDYLPAYLVECTASQRDNSQTLFILSFLGLCILGSTGYFFWKRNKAIATRQVEPLGPADSPSETEKERYLRAIKAIMERELGNYNFSVEDFANSVGEGRTTLNSKLSAYTGTTPMKYLRNYRLDKAKVLLRESNRTIQEIAIKTGFKTTSNLSNAFRKRFGMSPSAFRSEGM